MPLYHQLLELKHNKRGEIIQNKVIVRYLSIQVVDNIFNMPTRIC